MRKNITTFYVETLLLIAVFIAILLVLTQVFGGAKVQTTQARLLTNGVCLAENAAEAFSRSDSPETLAALLDQNGNTGQEGQTLTAAYDADMTPDPDGMLVVSVVWDPNPTQTGTLVSGQIQVLRRDTGDLVYSLETAVFLSEVTP
mgnify:CR=1 FL=1